MRTRWRTYVHRDCKAWRNRIAALAKKADLGRPDKGSTFFVEYEYGVSKSHADMDSLTHSAQDALSKDCLHMSDKEWNGVYRIVAYVKTKGKEFVRIKIHRQEKAGGLYQRPNNRKRQPSS